MKRIAMALLLAACGTSSPSPVDGGLDLGADVTSAADVVAAQDADEMEAGAAVDAMPDTLDYAVCRPRQTSCAAASANCCGVACTMVAKSPVCCNPEGAACTSEWDCCFMGCVDGVCTARKW